MRFALQVLAAALLLAAFLMWGAQHWNWQAMRAQEWQRIALLAVMLLGAAVVYFGTLLLSGVKLRSLLRR